MKRLPAIAAFFLLAGALAAQAAADSLSKGEDLLRRDRPSDAVTSLQAALRGDPSLEKAYLYLGLAYQQLGRMDDAVTVLKSGIAKSSAYLHLIYFNLGNCYFAQGKAAFAEEMYSEALKARPDYSSALLNRANARMSQKEYADAVKDYRDYLALAPDSPQRPSIERIISLVQGDLAAAEKQKEELAKREAEEAARKQSILDAVQQSLKDAASDTASVSAGAEGAQDYGDESSLAN